MAIRRREIDFGACRASSGVQLGQFADHAVRLVNSRLRLRRSRFGTAAQPFHFRMDAIRQSVLPLSLGMEIVFLGLQKLAVVSFDAQKAALVHAIEFNHSANHVFEEVAIVADRHARERRLLQERLQPLNSLEVQMIGRLVEQENVRSLNECLANCQPLAPAAGQGLGGSFEVAETGAAERLSDSRWPLPSRHCRQLERTLDGSLNCFARSELGNLRDATEPGVLAYRHCSAIRFHAAVKNFQERRFSGAVGADQANLVAFGHLE